MSGYNRTNVYDYVNRAVLAEYEDAYVSGVFEPVPQSFPAVCIREIGRFSAERNVTFSGEQGVWYSTFEVQVQTAEENSSLEDANEIMDVVMAAFQDLFYINTAMNIIENGDRGIYRLTATFRKINGLGDIIPTVTGQTGLTGATGQTS